MKHLTEKELKELIKHMRWQIAVNQNTEKTSHDCIWYLNKAEAELKRRNN